MEIQKLRIHEAIHVYELIKEGMHPGNLDLTIYSTNKSINFIEYMIESPPKITGNYFFGYYSGKMLVGFAQWSDLKNDFFLKNIYVNKNYRCMGIGRELIFHGINLAKKLNKMSVSLDVFSNNKIANDWYDSLGFKEITKSNWFESKSKVEDFTFQNDNFNSINGYFVENYPQTLEILKQFGFSSVNIVNQYNNESFKIGLLESKYFKIDKEIYQKHFGVFQILREIDPKRYILMVHSDEEKCPSYITFNKITSSKRMTKLI